MGAVAAAAAACHNAVGSIHENLETVGDTPVMTKSHHIVAVVDHRPELLAAAAAGMRVGSNAAVVGVSESVYEGPKRKSSREGR